MASAAVLTSLRQALQHDYAYADYAFKVLNAVGFPERFTLLIEVLQNRDSELGCDEAAKALHASGPAAAAALVPHYRQHLLEPIDLLALAEIPTLDVEEFLVTHFDHSMRYEQANMFVEVLAMVAARRFLEPLLAEWREGELAVGSEVRATSSIGREELYQHFLGRHQRHRPQRRDCPQRGGMPGVAWRNTGHPV